MPFIETLHDLSGVSQIFTMNLNREKRRSQAPDSRDTAERFQNDLLIKFEKTQGTLGKGLVCLDDDSKTSSFESPFSML